MAVPLFTLNPYSICHFSDEVEGRRIEFWLYCADDGFYYVATTGREDWIGPFGDEDAAFVWCDHWSAARVPSMS